MLQVVQYQKTGEIFIEDLPAPSCPENGILVKTAYSVISAGTEKISVTNTQASLIQRAKQQPDQVRQVIDSVKKEGIINTLAKVKSKLESYKSLGYSAAGVVLESKTDKFRIGDRVACGGAGLAVHAEYLAIPKNLAVKIPDNVEFEQACYTTLGAIALQGVRQANLRLGEKVAVIGLGLLGQITVQLLKASGCSVLGLDIDESLFPKAASFGCDLTLLSTFDNINLMKQFSKGNGFDAVIITASTSSNEPIELAIELARKKGRVVIVGAVNMNLPRSPFYEKELEITISCSYGPGRYDPHYEDEGIDYPFPYVRWTENRNMEAIVELIGKGSLDTKSLTTHIFSINDAVKAYDLITGKVKDDYLGILIKYPETNDIPKKFIEYHKEMAKDKIGIGFIGAGQFGTSYLLPHIKSTNSSLVAVSTNNPVNVATVAKQFGFKLATTDSESIITNPDIDLIFCATRHDSHSHYVTQALKNNKPIFVEKPLAVNREQMEEIDKLVRELNGKIMVGYNRRFSLPFKKIKVLLSQFQEPKFITYRVNAGKIPVNHWVYRENQGSGRIIGEACHFIDCMVYLTDSLPTQVFAYSLASSSDDVYNRDSVAIVLKFADGSVGNLNYLANGDSKLEKEYCEVFCGGSVAIMKNFEIIEFINSGKINKYNFDGKKGHKEEVIAVIESISQGKPFPISYEEIKAVSVATFAAQESLIKGLPVNI
ncbi:MAG: bi-domain-containing oxidoreductase [Candidatus Kapabacteria bacterium]|nr:bi-domain-containing oxidoreductase [Candidatus Kapabacteria bacterium]